MLILRDGLIVLGDGLTEPFRGSVLIEGSRIAGVESRAYPGGIGDRVVKLEGRLVMPGAINPHSHAVAPGPRFASGTPGVSVEEAIGGLRRHLAQGHTTLVDLDGFKVPEETAVVAELQPVRVESSTVHFPPMWDAAAAADGTGLEPIHHEMTAATMAASGAAVIGEVGAGMTLGGGGQDYMYIPAAIEKATGTRIGHVQSRDLKYAVLGTRVKPGASDRDLIQRLLDDYGLTSLTVDQLIDVIEGSVLPSFEVALEGILESVNVARSLNIPAILHNSAPSDEACREAAKMGGPLVIAGHTNHQTFTVAEAIDSARSMKEHGAYVELDTFDAWGHREMFSGPKSLLAIVEAGLADLFATDWAAGYWDGIFEAVEDVTRTGLVPLSKAVAMATGNVATAIPTIGQSRGFLKPGYLADIVVSDAHHPASVQAVVINGSVAFDPLGMFTAGTGVARLEARRTGSSGGTITSYEAG